MVSWIALALSVIGIFLNAKKIIWCWPVWIVSNIFWIIHTVNAGDTAATVLWFVFLASNMYGAYEWNKDNNISHRDDDLYKGYTSDEDGFDDPGWQGHWNRKDGY